MAAGGLFSIDTSFNRNAEVFAGKVIDEITGRDIADVKRLWRSQGLKDATIACSSLA